MANQTCSHCGRTYASAVWLQKHLIKCPKSVIVVKDHAPLQAIEKKMIIKKSTPTLKLKRKGIDSKLRIRVWEKYIGDTIRGRCFCCWNAENLIHPFSYSNTFQAGHIISYKNGGKEEIDNLLPICRDCNMKMSSENWDDYIGRHSHLPLRIYGANPPERVIWAATILQSLARMYLERKKPDSHWRIEWGRRYLREC